MGHMPNEYNRFLFAIQNRNNCSTRYNIGASAQEEAAKGAAQDVAKNILLELSGTTNQAPRLYRKEEHMLILAFGKLTFNGYKSEAAVLM